ncbi:hypothetical protein [Gottfriedia acidiceleris]|nr:hypothetical protein [Gottfriedia acidiceleris]
MIMGKVGQVTEGWMVTGPANTKSEALIISNELMKKFLHNKLK